MSNPAPNAVYGYARTSRPAEDLSLDDLVAPKILRIRKHADESEWPLAEIFVDRGISASIAWHERPQGRKLFARLQPGDAVIIARLDHCFRSADAALTTIADFEARGIRLLTLDCGQELTKGAGGRKLITTILAAIAEFEREVAIERDH